MLLKLLILLAGYLGLSGASLMLAGLALWLDPPVTPVQTAVAVVKAAPDAVKTIRKAKRIRARRGEEKPSEETPAVQASIQHRPLARLLEPSLPVITREEQGLVDAINADRRRYGQPPLTVDAQLMACARMRAKKTNEWNVHDGYASDARSFGYRCHTLAENAAWEFPYNPASEAASSWAQSSGHARAMRGPYTDVGVGVAVGNWRGQSGKWIIALFGRAD